MRYGILVAWTMWLVGVGFVNGQAPVTAESDQVRASVTSDKALAADRPASSELLGWTRADYLWWRVKDGPVPVALATRGGNFPTGIIGAPGSSVILGAGDADFGPTSGVRLSGGLWLNAERTLAWDASGFMLERATFSAALGSDAIGNPVFSRPFVDANTGRPAALVVSSPGSFAGYAKLDMHNRLWGADTNVRAALSDAAGPRFEGFVGLRYLGLDEGLVVEQGLTNLPATTPPLLFRDRFYVSNQFVGAQVGGQVEYQCDRWFVGALGKVAAGANHSRIEVTGGGLLVAPTNNGEYDHYEFAYAAEVELRVGCRVSDCIRVFAGYDCLYWSNVGRPGDQIDPAINANRFSGSSAGPARPSFSFHDSAFWAHGVSVGVELRY